MNTMTRDLALTLRAIVEEAIAASADEEDAEHVSDNTWDLACALSQPLDKHGYPLIGTVDLQDGGYLTRDEGFIITMPDGTEFVITITQQ